MERKDELVAEGTFPLCLLCVYFVFTLFGIWEGVRREGGLCFLRRAML